MRYEYKCPSCGDSFVESFPMGEAERTVQCRKCGAAATRVFGCNFILNGSGFASANLKFKREMTERNLRAGHRMKAKKPPVRLAALDHGGGDVRPVARKT
jgi:putative FmdB family regulatory protein